uniref:EndoU domain-containing protein n=1 Tax=Paenibacillus campi TaxID=3106031 RepID=UPI002AFEB5F9
ADGTQEHRTYDAAGQLTGLTVLKPDGSTMAQTGYTYDADGNVTNEDGGQIDLPAGSVNNDVYGPGLSPDAGSDAAASGNGAQSASTAVQADVYTGAGTGSPPTNPTVTQDTYGLLGDLTMTYTADNRLATVNGQAVQYDAEGNMLHGPLQGSLQDYHYDARNRLIAAGGVSYGYDNENNRTSITVNGVTTKQIINPQAVLSQVWMETDGNGNPTAWYVYGLGLISRYDASGNMQTYHYDLRGSTIALTDAKGNVTDTYTYDTYGEERSHEGTTNQPFQYDGRDGVQTDPNGLYQMRSQYYNPEIRRFVNRDVVTGTIADGLTMNRYAYVNGNPVSYVDPFGLSAEHSDAMRTGFSMALDAIPFVGTVKGIQEVLTGVDWITGQQLSVADRVAEGAGVLLSVLPEGKLWGTLAAKEAIDGGAWVWKQVGKEAVEETVDAAKKQGTRLKLNLQLFAGDVNPFKVSDDALHHANIGDFTRNPRTGEISKMSGGGHGQDNINFLEENGIEYNIEHTYPNGVRVGNVPGHKSKGKRSGIGQAWFPDTWTKEDINEAGEYLANTLEYENVPDGVTIFGEYNGVRVGVIKTNGKIGTIFPDNMIQP